MLSHAAQIQAILDRERELALRPAVQRRAGLLQIPARSQPLSAASAQPVASGRGASATA